MQNLPKHPNQMYNIPYYSNSKLRTYRASLDENNPERLCDSLMFAALSKQIKYPEESEAMKLGSYFEYCAGFSTDPVTPPTLKNGNLPEAFARAQAQAQILKQITKSWFTGAVETQSKFSIPIAEKEFIGFYDFVDYENNRIVDIKYSGLLHNKWDGWARPGIMYSGENAQQALTYSLAYYMIWNVIPTFEFWVFSSTKLADARVFAAKYTQDELMRHKLDITGQVQAVEFQAAMDVSTHTNYPALHRCYDCPLKETCKDFSTQPEKLDL